MTVAHCHYKSFRFRQRAEVPLNTDPHRKYDKHGYDNRLTYITARVTQVKQQSRHFLNRLKPNHQLMFVIFFIIFNSFRSTRFCAFCFIGKAAATRVWYSG